MKIRLYFKINLYINEVIPKGSFIFSCHCSAILFKRRLETIELLTKIVALKMYRMISTLFYTIKVTAKLD